MECLLIDSDVFVDGDRSVPETSQDTKVTIQDNDGQSVTSQDYDSDTEVYCDTSDLPLVSVIQCHSFIVNSRRSFGY